jgi:hypothetical protein
MTASDPRPASHNTASADEGHAVRWAARTVRGQPQWTRWHYLELRTIFGGMTVCGRLAPATGAHRQRGETALVDCKRCRKWLEGRNGGKAVNDE